MAEDAHLFKPAEGHVASVHEGEVAPPLYLEKKGKEDARILPHP
jgi:hypothetical protein